MNSGAHYSKPVNEMDNIVIREFVEALDVQLVVLASSANPLDFVVIYPVIRFRFGIGMR